MLPESSHATAAKDPRAQYALVTVSDFQCGSGSKHNGRLRLLCGEAEQPGKRGQLRDEDSTRLEKHESEQDL